MRPALRRLASRHWWLGMTVAGWAFAMFASGTPRGFNGYGVWQLERIEGAREWLARLAQGTSAFDPNVARELLVAEPYQGPASGLLPALLGRLVGGSGDTADLARLANILFVCLTAWCLFSIGRRAGGLLGGLGAAVTLLSVPRIWGAATSPGLTAAALFTITLAAMCLAHARDRLGYLVPALLALAAALLTTQLAWLLLLPWVYWTFFDAQRSEARGLLRARPLTLWAPFVFPAGIVLAMFVFAPFRDGGLAELGQYLEAFVRLPREPTLYLGEVFDNERLPWHAAPVLIFFTTPPTLLFLAIFGITVSSSLGRSVRDRLRRRSGPRATEDGVRIEALRLSWSMLLLTLALPLLMGTTHSHGLDLLALALPWMAVYSGIGLSVVLRVIAERVGALFEGRSGARFVTLGVVTTLAWGVFVFAFKDTQQAYPEVESYYNWMLGGADGAAQLGLPRNPLGPPPPHFLSALVEPDAEAGVALIPSHSSDVAVVDRYRHHGLIPPGLWIAPLEAAELVVFRFDALAPGYYALLPDLYATIVTSEGDRVRWLRREGVPLFVAVRLSP